MTNQNVILYHDDSTAIVASTEKACVSVAV